VFSFFSFHCFLGLVFGSEEDGRDAMIRIAVSAS
jgi:hypothetical protein